NRTMPPWFAAEKIGHEFSNSRRLSDSELKLLHFWIDAGCAEGEIKDAPQRRKWPQGWSIGEPDAIVQIPKPVAIPAEGTMPYQYTKVPTAFGEDKWVQAVELLP